MRWCRHCACRRAVVDEGTAEAYSPGNREITYWVVSLECGHQIQTVLGERIVTEF